MKTPLVIIGIGEMGGVFARGLLRLGHPVYPVVRGQSMAEVAAAVPAPEVVLVAVAEKDLQGVLADLPEPWRDRVALLQNELLPGDWADLPEPTVISVWFEKKPGMDFKVILPSTVHGPRARLLAEALDTLGIPTRILERPGDLEFELVVKNLYILTTNIAGLEVGGTVGDLWFQHRDLALAVADDVIRLQQALTGHEYDRDALLRAMTAAFEGDPHHKCKGRSAPARLTRALDQARRLHLHLPTLERIHKGLNPSSHQDHP